MPRPQFSLKMMLWLMALIGIALVAVPYWVGRYRTHEVDEAHLELVRLREVQQSIAPTSSAALDKRIELLETKLWDPKSYLRSWNAIDLPEEEVEINGKKIRFRAFPKR